jgi:teichuronic acid biosynthesis glycosyltransferase TuaG
MSSLISIIMPVYNNGNYVAEAIQSVMDQTYLNWELLVVNDGSTDHTAKEIGRFTDARIKYFFQPNKGVSAARNVGLKMMQGDFFCLLDADDVMPKKSLANRWKVFQSSENIHFVDGSVNVYDHSLSQVIRVWRPSYAGEPFGQLLSLSGKCFFGPTWMIKRDLHMEYSFQEGMTHGEDLLFYITIAPQGVYAFTEDVVLHYRSNPFSAMRNLDALARGYRQLGKSIFKKYRISVIRRLFFWMKVRKIMFLSFTSNGEFGKGLEYLIFGYLK